MNPAPPTRFSLAPTGPRFYLQLGLAWALVVCAAMLYCWMHALVAGTGRHEPIVTVRWAAVHWGSWPLLLPLCFALIRRLQRRHRLLTAAALATPLAVLGATLAAYTIDRLWGGQWTLVGALHHMTPIATGSYAVFLGVGLWLLGPQALRPVPPLQLEQAGPTLAVSTGSREQHIRADQVHWVQGARNYAELHAAKASYIMRTSLRELEALLADQGFIRVHRSYLVNRRHVDALQHSRGEALLKLSDGAELPVGRSYRQRVEAAMVADQASTAAAETVVRP